jgi:hypothetical protein
MCGVLVYLLFEFFIFIFPSLVRSLPPCAVALEEEGSLPTFLLPIFFLLFFVHLVFFFSFLVAPPPSAAVSRLFRQADRPIHLITHLLRRAARRNWIGSQIGFFLKLNLLSFISPSPPCARPPSSSAFQLHAANRLLLHVSSMCCSVTSFHHPQPHPLPVLLCFGTFYCFCAFSLYSCFCCLV